MSARVLELVIRGRVQGVGFRHFVATRARARGISGVVRNLPDGAVQVRAEGDPGSLEALAEALRSGPPAARVEHVDALWRDEPAQGQGFRITS